MFNGSFNGQLEMAPWDALLLEVRRSSYRVAWIDQRIEGVVQEERALVANAGDDGMEEGERRGMQRYMDERIRDWLTQSRKERAHLANSSRIAIAAGLTQRLVSQVALEAETITRVLVMAMRSMELDEESQRVGVACLQQAITEVALERRGELVPGTGEPVGSGAPVKMRAVWNALGQLEFVPEA